MLEVASGFFTQSWWNVFLPGFLIYITVLAINLVGIGLRDALDPRLSQ
jgi:peptide/nickel transport system permease protein